MDTLITAVVSIIIGAIITESIRFFVPVWRRKIKAAIPKSKSIRDRIRLMIKYPFFITSYFLVFKYVCFGKWFVVVFIMITIILTIFTAFDVLYYSFVFAVYSVEKERLNKDVDRYSYMLANCDPKDIERKKSY